MCISMYNRVNRESKLSWQRIFRQWKTEMARRDCHGRGGYIKQVTVSKEEDEQKLQVINDWMKTQIQHKQTTWYLNKINKLVHTHSLCMTPIQQIYNYVELFLCLVTQSTFSTPYLFYDFKCKKFFSKNVRP